MNVSEAISEIDNSVRPFEITFFKRDGSIRTMTATKRRKERPAGGHIAPSSGFKGDLQEANLLLLNEQPGNHPHSVKIFSLLTFKGEKVFH